MFGVIYIYFTARGELYFPNWRCDCADIRNCEVCRKFAKGLYGDLVPEKECNGEETGVCEKAVCDEIPTVDDWQDSSGKLDQCFRNRKPF